MKLFSHLLLCGALFFGAIFVTCMVLWPVSYRYVHSITYVTSPDRSPQRLFNVFTCDGRCHLAWNEWTKPTEVAWMYDAKGGLSLQRYEGWICNSEKVKVHSDWSYLASATGGSSFIGIETEYENVAALHVFRSVAIPYSYTMICGVLALALLYSWSARRAKP